MTLPVLATRMEEQALSGDSSGLVLIQATNSSIVDCWGVVNVHDMTFASWGQSGTSVSA